jgi:pantetheine-phosphate adenylyltransferase
MKTALYAFSGDPITFGHIDIIRRAASAFDRLIVAIGVNPDKQYTFSLEERESMARHVLAGLANVTVTSFRGLLVDFAYENGAGYIVKGVRNAADFDYEMTLHQMGESQRLGIDTVILMTRPELGHISSSAVRALQKEHGLIHEFVPLHVKQCIERKLSGQFILGVTGEIGAGKTWFCNRLVALGKVRGIEVHNIELDHIGHQITNTLTEPQYRLVREKIAGTFGSRVMDPDGFINRKILGEAVFNDPAALEKLNGIMLQPILVRLRREIYGLRGLILINAALTAESGISHLSNNHVVLVKTGRDRQKTRLLERGMKEDQLDRRLASQYSTGEKREILLKSIARDNQGKLWEFDNDENTEGDLVGPLFDDILKTLTV